MTRRKHYPVLHVQDNTAQHALRWQDHLATLPPPPPPRLQPAGPDRPHPGATCCLIGWVFLCALAAFFTYACLSAP